jgi:uncharacterized protein (DUF433 family)
MTFDAIEPDPNRLSGQPCVRGTRITVRRALQLVAQYPNRAELRADYPELTDDVVRQVLHFAAASLDSDITHWQAA